MVMCVGCGALAFVLFLRSCPPGSLALDFPLRGKWRTITGGRTSLTNYHHGQPPQQNFAIDLVLNDNAAGSLGQTIYSPCSCTVDRVSTDTTAAEGNLIVLRSGDGTSIWLAHLQNASIRVQPGDRLKVGEAIARVGSTGSAESPHLHIHAEKNGAAVPIRFGSQKRYLVRGDVLDHVVEMP